MGSKALSLGIIEMYNGMLSDEFKELKSVMDSRRAVIRKNVQMEVEFDMGVLQLRKQIADHETMVETLKNQFHQLTGSTYWDKNTTGRHISEEVERRLDREDPIFQKLLDSMQSLKKQIALCSAPKEVQEVFSQVPTLIKELTKEIKALPAPKKANKNC